MEIDYENKALNEREKYTSTRTQANSPKPRQRRVLRGRRYFKNFVTHHIPPLLVTFSTGSSSLHRHATSGTRLWQVDIHKAKLSVRNGLPVCNLGRLKNNEWLVVTYVASHEFAVLFHKLCLQALGLGPFHQSGNKVQGHREINMSYLLICCKKMKFTLCIFIMGC